MKQVTQKDFINFIKEKQENATNNEEQLRKLATSRDDLDTANKWWGVASAYQHIVCYLQEVEIVPERIIKQKEFEEKVIIEPFVEELKKIDPNKIPITPYIEPKVELLRNDRFREFDCVFNDNSTTTITIDAKTITAIRLCQYDSTSYEVDINVSRGLLSYKNFVDISQAREFYNDIIEWWKYWMQN